MVKLLYNNSTVIDKWKTGLIFLFFPKQIKFAFYLKWEYIYFRAWAYDYSKKNIKFLVYGILFAVLCRLSSGG